MDGENADWEIWIYGDLETGKSPKHTLSTFVFAEQGLPNISRLA